jgi:hypothetical protein
MQFNTKILSVRQRNRYDHICFEIRSTIGSFETIARKVSGLNGEEISGETIRRWFTDRSIPTEYCFVLYELMEQQINVFHLQPWLARYFDK